MEFSRLRHGHLTTITVTGRLDAAGAAELDLYVEHCRGEDPSRDFLLDLTGVTYMSSAAMRVLTHLQRQLGQEQGALALFGLQPFCREVLHLTGLDQALNVFDRETEAEAFCRRNIPSSPPELQVGEKCRGQVGNYEFVPGVSAPCALCVTGDYSNVLHSQLSAALTPGCPFDRIRNSVGIGALGSSPAEYLAAQGHLFTVAGRLYWTPADTGIPDFLYPEAEKVDRLLLQCGFNLAPAGPPQELIRFVAADTEGGADLGQVVRELLRLTGERHADFKGIIWITLLAELGVGFARSLQLAPLAELAPNDGKTIDHPLYRARWFAEDRVPCLQEGIGIVTGVAADLMHDLSDYPEWLLDRMFRLSPAALGGKDGVSHLHGAFFRPGNYPETTENDLDAAIQVIGDAAEPIRIGEVLATTRLRRATIALALIDNLELPEQLDPAQAHRLDYRLHRARTLLETYGKTGEFNMPSPGSPPPRPR